MKTLVVGLGNPILGDDGVGWRIAQELQNSGDLPLNVDVEFLAVGGISLMEALISYDKAIIIDTIVTHQAPLGAVSIFKLEDLSNPSTGHLGSAHDTSLQNAIQMGQDLGAQLPQEIIVIAVESQKIYDFSEDLSSPVSAAIPKAVGLVKMLLGINDQVIPQGSYENIK